jgi:hypothetical protein
LDTEPPGAAPGPTGVVDVVALRDGKLRRVRRYDDLMVVLTP